MDKTLEQLADENVKALNALVDPIAQKMIDNEKVTAAELKKAGELYSALQKQYDELDMKLQKATMQPELSETFGSVLAKTMNDEWLAKYKSNRRSSFEIKGHDLHSKTAGTVVRVADTIQPQFTQFVYSPARKFHVRDIIPVGTTSSATVWMPYESAITNSIARVAEGGAKPLSDFTPAVVKWAVEKIATTLKFSEEILEDMPQFISYLTTRWLELLKQAEDNKLLYGTGSSDIKGLTVSGAAYSDVLASSLVKRYDVLMAAVYQIKTANFTPNYVLVNPADGLKIRGEKDTSGQPIFPAYTNNSVMSVGGVTIIETPAVVAGDFLAGDFNMGAQIFDRKSANISFYDQNEDDATKNLILAVIEERLALVTFHPSAFCFGTFLNALATGSA